MFDLIKKMIGNNRPEIGEEDALTAHPALTVLMLEAARADGECSEAEKDHLIATLETKFNIPGHETRALIDKQDGDTYVDLFQYTNFINDNFTEDQKISIVESAWEIILVDDHLEAHEDHFVHKLASLLRLNHSDLIQAKKQARQQLG